jgi:Protein of unknown function (DUF3574)
MHKITLVLCTTLFLFSCTSARNNNASTNTTEQWIRSELYFSLSRPGLNDISITEWQAFLTQQITPMIPEGFTELIAQGHYPENGESKSETVRVLVILHPEKEHQTFSKRSDQLGRLYCATFGQNMVLRTDSPTSLHVIYKQ